MRMGREKADVLLYVLLYALIYVRGGMSGHPVGGCSKHVHSPRSRHINASPCKSAAGLHVWEIRPPPRSPLVLCLALRRSGVLQRPPSRRGRIRSMRPAERCGTSRTTVAAEPLRM